MLSSLRYSFFQKKQTKKLSVRQISSKKVQKEPILPILGCLNTVSKLFFRYYVGVRSTSNYNIFTTLEATPSSKDFALLHPLVLPPEGAIFRKSLLFTLRSAQQQVQILLDFQLPLRRSLLRVLHQPLRQVPSTPVEALGLNT